MDLIWYQIRLRLLDVHVEITLFIFKNRRKTEQQKKPQHFEIQAFSLVNLSKHLMTSASDWRGFSG